MLKILVITEDVQWCSQLLHSPRLKEYDWFFGSNIGKPVEKGQEAPDLVLIDVNLLPPPESADLFRIHHILDPFRCVAVYTPGRALHLADVRKAFIAGAQDLVEKPSSPGEVQGLLQPNPTPS